MVSKSEHFIFSNHWLMPRFSDSSWSILSHLFYTFSSKRNIWLVYWSVSWIIQWRTHDLVHQKWIHSWNWPLRVNDGSSESIWCSMCKWFIFTYKATCLSFLTLFRNWILRSVLQRPNWNCQIHPLNLNRCQQTDFQ